MKAIYFIAILFFLALFTFGCESIERATQQARKDAVVDAPSLTDFVPANMFARTMEEQDKGVHAYAYMLVPMTGKFFFVCEAAAFPYPGGTQYTAPQIPYGNSYHAITSVPQADPNTLYTPETADATTVPCWASEHDINNAGNGFESAYFEDNLIVIPGKLDDDLVYNPNRPFVR